MSKNPYDLSGSKHIFDLAREPKRPLKSDLIWERIDRLEKRVKALERLVLDDGK